MYKFFWVSIALIFLAGCNSMPTSQDNLPSTQLQENEGMVFGTFSRNHRQFEYHSQYFYFKNTNTQKEYMIKSRSENFMIGKAPVDIESPKSKGVMFTFNLPAGDYHFYNFRLYHSTGMYHADFFSKEDYSIPFKVLPHKATYVGDIKLIPLLAKNFLGLPIPKGGRWEIRNEKVRDISKFVDKFPNVDWSGNTSAIPYKPLKPSNLVTLIP